MSCPDNTTCPPVICKALGNKRIKANEVIDLPEPLPPTSAKTSPFLILKLMGRISVLLAWLGVASNSTDRSCTSNNISCCIVNPYQNVDQRHRVHDQKIR